MVKQNTMSWQLFLLFSFCMLYLQCNGEFLHVSGREFIYDNKRVFLSGPNYAWVYYGWDFGNYNYQSTGPLMEQWIKDISNAGGNSLRVWVHVEAGSTPEFNSQGYVIATDGLNNLIRDLSRFLDVAQEYNVFVIFCLFNGASMGNANYKNLILDSNKTQSYIDNALTHMAAGLANKPALAAWEIMNEPEGSIAIQSNVNPCFDTTILAGHGGGWSGANIPMETMMRFVNRLAGAIKRADPKTLVTVGSYCEIPQTSAFPGMYNFYEDHCLLTAGGDPQGIIDFQQMHTYAWEGKWGDHAPFRVYAADYLLHKPLVIGEFSFACAGGETLEQLWNRGFDLGYDGLWSWQYNNDNSGCMDTRAQQNQGMQTIRSRPGVPLVIHG